MISFSTLLMYERTWRFLKYRTNSYMTVLQTYYKGRAWKTDLRSKYSDRIGLRIYNARCNRAETHVFGKLAVVARRFFIESRRIVANTIFEHDFSKRWTVSNGTAERTSRFSSVREGGRGNAGTPRGYAYSYEFLATRRGGRHSGLCIFARLLSSSLLSKQRGYVSHALYLDARRRVLARSAVPARARPPQKYVILVFISAPRCLPLSSAARCVVRP